MESFFRKKKITSILFLICIFTFSISNLLGSKNITENITEDKINENFIGRFKFIEIYGFLQKLMYKNEESNFEVVKDNSGYLHYTNFSLKPNSVDEIASSLASLKENLNNKETKLIYLMTPDKYISGITKFETGLPYNYANETADNFLKEIDRVGIDSIDFRKKLLDSGIPLKKLFYKTDHHWTTETAFSAYIYLVQKLESDYALININPEGYYTNKDNFNFITYKNSYLGTAGRKTGLHYGGIDDFSLIYPKFKTSYRYYGKTGDKEIKTSGRFEESLIAINVLKNNDIYLPSADKYSSYLFGNQGIVHIINNENKIGPKVLIIKDSLAVPLSAFLSNVCSNLYMVDPRYFEGNITEYVNSISDLDFIFVSFSPQELTKEFFRFT